MDIGNEADPSSDPTIVNTKARKALNKLLPLLKSEDPNLNFREVSKCGAEEPHNSMTALSEGEETNALDVHTQINSCLAQHHIGMKFQDRVLVDSCQASMLTQALVKELLLASNGAASKQTLAWLWEEVMAAQAPCKRPEDEATVAANLIMMTAGLCLAPCIVKDAIQMSIILLR